jgi:hypothetical protein
VKNAAPRPGHEVLISVYKLRRIARRRQSSLSHLRDAAISRYAGPPAVDIEYEMDCRRVTRETVI